MKCQGDYKGNFRAMLMIKDSLYKVVSFNSLEKAKRWAKKEAKNFRCESIRDLIRVDIDEKRIVGYEISSSELLKYSERVL